MAKLKDPAAKKPLEESEEDKKKKKVDPTESLLSEIEEDIRREEVARIWNTYANYVLGAAAAIVLAVAGYQFYAANQQQAALEAARLFNEGVALSQQGDFETAKDVFEDLADQPGQNYGVLAAFRQADLLLTDGNTAEALDVYAWIFENPAVDVLLQDAAVLLYVTHAMGSEPVEDLQNLIQPMTGPNNPLRYSALELSAYLALETGDIEAARADLQSLLDDLGTPVNMRVRANEVMDSLPSAAEAPS